MTPSALADRIAAMDWSGVSLQHRLAVIAACETLKSLDFKGLENAHSDRGVDGCVRGGDLNMDILVCQRDVVGAFGSQSSNAAPAVVLPFPVLRGPSPELLRNSACTERRVTLRRMDGSTAATALCCREERWDWIVSTTCELCQCDPEQVGMVDNTVTVDGLPVFSC